MRRKEELLLALDRFKNVPRLKELSLTDRTRRPAKQGEDNMGTTAKVVLGVVAAIALGVGGWYLYKEYK